MGLISTHVRMIESPNSRCKSLESFCRQTDNRQGCNQDADDQHDRLVLQPTRLSYQSGGLNDRFAADVQINDPLQPRREVRIGSTSCRRLIALANSSSCRRRDVGRDAVADVHAIRGVRIRSTTRRAGRQRNGIGQPRIGVSECRTATSHLGRRHRSKHNERD
jgi:hypothetical protein